MKKVKIVLIALLLGIVMIFGVAGCNVDTQNDLHGKIDDLQTQIEELEERLAEMEDQLGDRDKKIEQLEKELAEKSTGTFYTLREAFVNGWLTREDIMSIAYYHNGGRWHNEEIMSEDYEPAPKKPEVLSEFTELKIKSTGAKYCRENYDIAEAEADGITITQYCGTYGDCVAVMIRGYLHYAEALWTDTVAGINIHYSDANSIKIWRETNGKEDNSKDELQDYVLKISADKQVYSVDEEIYIDIILENRSGADVEIAYYILFNPEWPTGEFPAIEQPSKISKYDLGNGKMISLTSRLGGCFPVGQHELKYRAAFYLDWETTESLVVVYSNTIEFSVIE